MNFPFTKKQQPRISKKQVATGLGAAAGIGLLAFGVKKLLEGRKQKLAETPTAGASALEARPQDESPRDHARPKNRVDRESFNSFPASDAPSHMPGIG